MQNLWDACLRRLEQELPAQQFNTWIRPLTLVPDELPIVRSSAAAVHT
jgi:chromosomal replication initiator protein